MAMKPGHLVGPVSEAAGQIWKKLLRTPYKRKRDLTAEDKYKIVRRSIFRGRLTSVNSRAVEKPIRGWNVS